MSGGGGGGYVAPNITSHDFENGLLSPYDYPWTGEAGGDKASVENDTSGLFGGKVAEIRYPATDITRSFRLNATTAAQRTGFGEEVWFRGEFAIQNTGANTQCLRKLFYLLPLISTANLFLVVGEENGILYCEYSQNGTPTRLPISPSVSIAHGVKYYLELRLKINSAAAVADGEIEIWLGNASPSRVNATGKIINNSGNATECIVDYYFGDQLQGSLGSVTAAEKRWWDNVAISSAGRIGPVGG